MCSADENSILFSFDASLADMSSDTAYGDATPSEEDAAESAFSMVRRDLDNQGCSDDLQVGPALEPWHTLDTPTVVFDAGEYTLINEIRSKLGEIEKSNGPLQPLIAARVGR